MLKFETVQDIINLEKEAPFSDRLVEKTIYKALKRVADNFPSRPAISFQISSKPGSSSETYTWSELHNCVVKAANIFRKEGIGKKDVIAFVLPNCSETAITFLAGAITGIVNPINALLEPKQIASILRETNAKAIVTLSPMLKTEVAQNVNEALKNAPNVKTVFEVDLVRYLSPPKSWIASLLRPKVTKVHSAKVQNFWDALSSADGSKLTFEDHEDDAVCANFHTGGTTGMPKVAQHRASGMLFNGWSSATLLFSERDCLICPLPLFHVYAAYPIFMTCLLSGAHMVLPTPQGYRGEGVFQNFWKLVEHWGVTFMVTVPTAITQLLQVKVDAKINSLRFALCGSSPLSTAQFREFQEQTGLKILEGYGMTEATCMISVNPPEGDRRIGSVGIRYPYTEVKILDCDSAGKVKKECKVDEVGEICVANPGVFEGKTYTDPDKNKGLFAKGTLMRTGDLGRMDKDGYLWITGRAKDLIIRGGHNIDPSLIEEVISSHPSVAMVGAIGQPDSEKGELPCAYVQLNDGDHVSGEELIGYCKNKITEKAALPKHVEIIAEMPLTAVGKIFKPELRKKAITRIFSEALSKAGVSATISKVEEHPKEGLKAHISGVKNADEVGRVLNPFTFGWELDEN